MAKKSLPKITPVDYETAKKESTFTDYITNDGFSKCNTNLCGNVDQLPSEIGNVIKKLQSKEVSFDRSDENDLNKFRLIYQYTHLPNYINRFTSENVNADLYEFFNKIKTATDFSSIKSAFDLNSTCASYFDYFFSAIKHCQDPNKYPLQHTFWKNLCKYYFPTTSENFGYDDLCNIYNSCGIPFSDTPKHVYFAAYMDQLAINLAKELAKNITTYASTKIGEIFNITEYDKIMGVSRGKHNNIILPAIPTPALELHDSVLEPDSTPDPDPDSDSDSGPDPSHPLNLILYGPPGTGKTYNTVNKALDIVQSTWLDDFVRQKDTGEKDKRKYAQQLFNQYKEKGQIVFTTFHQSMSYEDFVEGIKPIPPQNKEEQMVYDVQDGIFKQICENAKKISVENKSAKIDFSKTRVFKMSLGEKGKDADSVFEYCIENEVIALGWGGSNDFSKCKKRADFKKLDSSWGGSALEIFKEWMKIGDIVLISDGTKEVKGIAQIVGDYEFRDDPTIDMHQFRKAKWLYTGDNIPISKLYDKNLSQQSIYGFYKEKKGVVDNGGIKIDILNEIITGEINDRNVDNYVLIIDEINRGNVAQIFGELITLIEPSKRLGNDEEMKAALPYSSAKEGAPFYFGVPNNLYIIGTMNTADRSVEALDTALRRRFSFEEMMPKPELLGDKEVCGVKLSVLLETINARIVALKDREHQIGHSYFMGCPDDDAEAKAWITDVFKDKIIPLLQEYFYGDYKKIYYVLGPGFVKEVSENKPDDIFPVKIDDDLDIDQSMTRYEIKSFDEEEPDSNKKVNIFAAVNRLVKSKNDKNDLRIKLKDKKYQEIVAEGGSPKTIDIPLEEVIERELGGEDMSKYEVKSEEPVLSR